MRIVIFLFAVFICASCYTPTPVYSPSPPGFPPPQQTPIYAQMCGGMVGGRCSNPADYCYMPKTAICGAADASGVCRSRPQICTQEYAPVCGCGDQTYSNACVAASNGVSVAYDGPCR
ncbi:MAG: serine protease [Robiginitomaculum sp.]|nr:serine protease [Robiginitomaculum sp.]